MSTVEAAMGGAQLHAETGGDRSQSLFVAKSVGAGGVGAQSMVMGYNHDVPYRGRVFHVQTEDSGRSRGRIITHVFHAGTIVASARVDYGDTTTVREVVELLQTSHKSMMRRLVHGSLDEVIVRSLGDHPQLVWEPVRPPRPARPASPVLEAEVGSDPSQDLRSRLQALIEAMDMDNVNHTLENLRNNVAGALGVALVDYESGMCLGTSGSGLNMDVAAAGNMEVMKAKARVMRDLGIKGGIEDILITLESQYHIIRPIGTNLFFYLALDRKQGNLALARHKLASAAGEVKL